jgi:UPF0271 protein
MRIDLNSDVGESYGAWRLGDDEALLGVVTSANVACGFHAGDPATMRRTVTLAAANGVAIGAQVSYPDLVGFGRRELGATPQQIRDDVLYQLGALDGICRAEGTRVRYLRPHGALYHRCAVDPEAAEAAVGAAHAFDPGLAVVAPPGSAMLLAAGAAGLPTVREGFADRRYAPDGGLAPRNMAGAVIADVDAAVTQALGLVRDGAVTATDGSVLHSPVDTLCIHGDTPGAGALARAVRNALEQAGVTVAAAVP